MLTASQLTEWEAYDELDPIGEWRADWRMARLASLVAGIAMDLYGKKGIKRKNVADFMPVFDEEQAPMAQGQSIEEQKQILLGLAKMSFPKVQKKGTGKKTGVDEKPKSVKQ